MSRWRGRVSRAWKAFVGPEATTVDNLGTLGSVAVGAVLAPVIARRLAARGPVDQIVVGVVAGDLCGGLWANNTKACARWYERPGQGAGDHYRFALLHVHPFVVAWLDRRQQRTVPGWGWAAAHYTYMAMSTVVIRSYPADRRVLGVALSTGGIVLDRVLGPPTSVPWFAWAYYPKLLLGHAAAALWSDGDLV